MKFINILLSIIILIIGYSTLFVVCESQTSPAIITHFDVTNSPTINCTEVVCTKITKCIFPHIIVKDPNNPCCVVCL